MNNPIVAEFLKLGWTWGGNWETLKDCQHFHKIP
ncbi:M15 family metallopeptidase [Thermodesulfobacteriota bacterium]